MVRLAPPESWTAEMRRLVVQQQVQRRGELQLGNGNRQFVEVFPAAELQIGGLGDDQYHGEPSPVLRQSACGLAEAVSGRKLPLRT